MTGSTLEQQATFDPVAAELGGTMTDHLVRYAHSLLERGDNVGAQEIFKEATIIQMQALLFAAHSLKQGAGRAAREDEINREGL